MSVITASSKAFSSKVFRVQKLRGPAHRADPRRENLKTQDYSSGGKNSLTSAFSMPEELVTIPELASMPELVRDGSMGGWWAEHAKPRN